MPLFVTTPAVLALTTCPNQPVAEALAAALVEQSLVACVTLLPGATSFYRWQGVVQRDSEVLLLLKTQQSAVAALQAYLLQHHPYELPEFIVFPITSGLPAYLQWLEQAVTPSPSDHESE
ncbi:MAG: divalent-cation tolerance protein CutA [Gammaproteobacteria bacterium]|nr:divalent-cation tolerance protein CutA [Gammaproteobacteria bacterium]